MRTTLTLDDDVAVALERLRRTRDASLKDIVNDVLRRGLNDLDTRPKRREVISNQKRIVGAVAIGEHRQC